MEITEEQRQRWQENKESWANEAKTNIHNSEDLKKFADKLIEHCENLDGADYYEESANATVELAHAAVEMCAEQFGLSGLQVGYIMWGINDKLIMSEHDCGLKLLNYNNMLYPQYEDHFEKTLDKDTWDALRKKAKELVEKNNEEIHKEEAGEKYAFPASDAVSKHWESIANGVVPFGYTVVEK